MADTVQYHLERMLSELDDLEKRGLFTRSEIKEIVKKRRNFEYLLKRHSTLKQDYIRYIEYEKKFEALRRLRKKALIRKQNTGGKWKQSLCDKSSIMHIMLIYQRALTKYKGDLNLWLQYLEYCRSHLPRKLQKVTTKCLQVHSTVPWLWKYAATWEFENNLNVRGARALMQRGLYINPYAENLWIEYFQMELNYMQKLKARKLALGLPWTMSPGRNGNQQIQPCFVTKSDKEKAPVSVDIVADEEEGVSLEDKLSYKLAQSVYRNAIAAVAFSVGFRQRFLVTLDTFQFDDKSELEKEIQASIISNFPADESSWNWLARRHFESHERACQVFEDALESVPSSGMFEAYAQYLIDRLDAENVGIDCSAALESTQSRTHIADTLCQLYERANAAEICSESLAMGHLQLVLRNGRLEEALCLAIKFCGLIKLKKSASLWEIWIALEMKRTSFSATNEQNKDRREVVLKLFQESVKCVSLPAAQHLWLMALSFYTGHEKYIQIVLSMLEKVLSDGSGGRVGADLACTALNWMLQSQGLKQARKIYIRWLSLPGPSAEFFKLCITIEARHFSAGCAESFQHLRKLLKDAVELFGQHDTDLWIEHYREELKACNVQAASNVCWQAKKYLNDPSVFIEKLQML